MTRHSPLPSLMLTAAWLATLLCQPATATESRPPDPLHAAAAIYRDALGSPALAIAAITPEEITVAAVGERVVGWSVPVRTSDRFHTGSDAKAMFASVAARLVEAGTVSWSTRLVEVFPESVSGAGRAYAEVTLADLLRHRGGMPALDDLDALAAVPVFSGSPRQQRAAFTAWALQQSPAAKPIHEPLYSNAGYVVAAAMLERRTGRSFEDLMQALLYKPLGMRVSYAWPASGRWPLWGAPWGHEYVDGRFVARSPNWAPAKLPAWLRPAAGVSLCTADFARFVQWQLQGLRGQARLLTPASFRELHRPIDGYALGWQVVEHDGRAISTHVGASGLFAAAMWLDPETGAAAVAMANGDSELVQIGVQQVTALLADELGE